MHMKSKNNPKILIIGGGFAGLAASKELGAFGDVTVIDKNPSFEFAPNIHELVSGFKAPAEVRLDIQEIVGRRGQKFVQEKVVDIDRENRHVTTSAANTFNYDYLIISIGGISNDRGVPGVEEHSYPFKSAAQCYTIGKKLFSLEDKGLSYTVTIVGGGVEGIESLGEILRRYRKSKHLSVRLIEAENQLLPGMPGKVNQDILKICQNFPVSFHFRETVSQVDEDSITLSDGKTLHSDITIWTGGVRSNPQLEKWGLAEKGAWPQVNRFLQSSQDSNIFIIGDSVDAAGGGEKQAYLALEMGQITAKNVKSIFKGHQPSVYTPKELPSVYTFGNLNCFVIYKGLVFSGLPFSGLKEAIYQLNMANIQGICEQPDQIKDIFERVLNGSVNSLQSFIEAPISLISKFGIDVSYR